MQQNTDQRGNALWFLLIAIVLLGGLTILMTRSGSSVDQSGDVEQMRVLSSQVLRYAKGIETAIDQMKSRGVSENDISFLNADTAVDYTNPGCASSACRVFDIGGGGQTYRDPPAAANGGAEWIFTGANNIGTADGPVGTTSARTGNDLIMLMPGINRTLCLYMNRELKVGTAGSIPAETTATKTDPFSGIFDAPLNIIAGAPTPFELDRHQAGCYSDAGTLYFYFVLLAR